MQIDIPKNEDLEARILSGILHSDLVASYCIPNLEDDDFFETRHKILLQAIKARYRGVFLGLDVLASYLKEKKLSKELPLSVLVHITNYTPVSPAEIQEEIGKLKNLAILRKLIYLGRELQVASAQEEASAEKLIAEHQDKILQSFGIRNTELRTIKNLNENLKNGRSFSDQVKWLRDRYNQGLPTYEGIPSYYPLLDDTIGYFQNSCLYYIGARTSMGKTTLMLNLIHNMSQKHKIGVFSLEMPSKILFEKLMCLHAKVKYSWYSKGNFTSEQQEKLYFSAAETLDNQVFFEDPSSLSVMNLSLRAKRMKQNHKIEILFIDYLTRITSDTKYPSKHLQVDEISKRLQCLAKELKIPIICLAQLNRASASRENPRPSLADFRESGSIEEDCDAALLLHRPEYYNPADRPGEVQVIVAKNRLMGTIKTISFHCDSKISERYSEKEDKPEPKSSEKFSESELDQVLMRM